MFDLDFDGFLSLTDASPSFFAEHHHHLTKAASSVAPLPVLDDMSIASVLGDTMTSSASSANKQLSGGHVIVAPPTSEPALVSDQLIESLFAIGEDFMYNFNMATGCYGIPNSNNNNNLWGLLET